MKKTAGILTLTFVGLLIVALGRAAEDKSDSSALQGTWKGKEIGNDANDAASLVIKDKTFEYHGVDTNDWCKGTFTLKEDAKPRLMLITFTETPGNDSSGKTANVIYEISGNTLKVAGSTPGTTNVPSGFDDSEARKFTFKKE